MVLSGIQFSEDLLRLLVVYKILDQKEEDSFCARYMQDISNWSTYAFIIARFQIHEEAGPAIF